MKHGALGFFCVAVFPARLLKIQMKSRIVFLMSVNVADCSRIKQEQKMDHLTFGR